MASYNVVWRASAERDLRKLDHVVIPKILASIADLALNQSPPQMKKLVGAESTYRIRIGDYRVIYQVDADAKSVTIYHIRHRREAYR